MIPSHSMHCLLNWNKALKSGIFEASKKPHQNNLFGQQKHTIRPLTHFDFESVLSHIHS